MLRKRIKKNTLKWKKIYAGTVFDMMDEGRKCFTEDLSDRVCT